MSSPPSETPPPASQARPDRGLREFGEDTTGFGQIELRTLWHTLVRPAVVLEAYMTAGPTGGGLYSRPMRLYLAMCGFLMLVLFLQGGSQMMLDDLPAPVLNDLLAQSGKSRDAFMADADGWMTLLMVPLLAAIYAMVSAPLIRLWDPEKLGWRRGFRATFAYLNTWTVPILPFAWIAYDRNLMALAAVLTIGLSLAAFLRAGKGRWYRTIPGGVAKSLVLAVVLQLAALLGSIPIMAIGILGGLHGA